MAGGGILGQMSWRSLLVADDHTEEVIMNFKFTGLALAALLFSTSAVLASEDVSPEMKTKIEDMLKAQGYEVGKIKKEDGNYEAYVKKGGEKLEIVLNEKLEIVKSEND